MIESSSQERAQVISNSSCQDLVVFNYANLDGLAVDFRTFKFFDTDIKIKQAWSEGGKGGSDIGFGCSVYNCSFVLAQYIEDNPSIVADLSCIELGCGPGLTSIVAALANPKNIVATDGDSISVELTNENMKQQLSLKKRIKTKANAKVLLWGNDKHLSSFIDKYDTILVADVVAVPYEQAYHDLLYTLKYLLKPLGKIYLCYQQRHTSENTFFNLFYQQFHVVEIDQNELHPDFRNTNTQVQVRPIKLYIATNNHNSNSTNGRDAVENVKN